MVSQIRQRLIQKYQIDRPRDRQVIAKASRQTLKSLASKNSSASQCSQKTWNYGAHLLANRQAQAPPKGLLNEQHKATKSQDCLQKDKKDASRLQYGSDPANKATRSHRSSQFTLLRPVRDSQTSRQVPLAWPRPV